MGGEEDAVADIRASLAVGGAEDLREVVNRYASYAFRDEASGDGVFCRPAQFEALVALLGDRLLVESPISSKVMILLEAEWGTFSRAQQMRLVEAITGVLSELRDEMSQAIVFELLGQYLAWPNGLDVLEALASSPAEAVREWVPHALTHIARRSADSEARFRVTELLKRMSRDDSEAVQVEAVAALDHLRE